MAKGATKPIQKVEKNIAYRGKPVVTPADGKIPYDATVWQARDQGDYIHTISGEVRGEDGFDWNHRGDGGSGESDGDADWGEFSQDAVGDFGGAQVKTGAKK